MGFVLDQVTGSNTLASPIEMARNQKACLNLGFMDMERIYSIWVISMWAIFYDTIEADK